MLCLALTSNGQTGDREFTKSPLGLNQIVKLSAQINAFLPENLRIERPTGHASRRTMSTTAMQAGFQINITSKLSSYSTRAGVDSGVITMATKHRDVTCFVKEYAVPNSRLLGKSSVEMQKFVSAQEAQQFVDKDFESTSESDSKSSSPILERFGNQNSDLRLTRKREKKINTKVTITEEEMGQSDRFKSWKVFSFLVSVSNSVAASISSSPF